MLPLEIHDHKRTWRNKTPYTYHTHSDMRSRVQDWCKFNTNKHQWHLTPYVEAYNDFLEFEMKNDYEFFRIWYKELWGA